MCLLLTTLFNGNWKAPLIICALILEGGLSLQNSIEKDNTERELALSHPQPDVTSLDTFSKESDIHLAKEVNVLARLNTDYNYELVQTSNKYADKTRYMFVFFCPNQTNAANTARAAVIVKEDEKNLFLELITKQRLGAYIADTSGADDPINTFTIAELHDRNPDLKKLAIKAFEEVGLKRSSDFIYIEPFLKGRQAGLTPDYGFAKT